MTTEQKWQAEALHYAQNMSKAPDKETPDWIMHDYLQGIEAYKSALRKAIEEEIARLNKKITMLTPLKSIGYIAQREQCKWMLRRIDTVEP
jgi:hypothetical protein